MISQNRNLLDYFPNFGSTDSLFAKMASLGAPWSSEIGQDMDIAYFTWYSGIKNPSFFVEQNSVNGSVNSTVIARILYSMYAPTWQRLWDAFNIQYSPINNYNIKETVDRTQNSDRSITRKNDLSSTVDGTINTTTGDNTVQDSTSSVTGKSTSSGKETTTGSNSGKVVTENTGKDTELTTQGITIQATTAGSVDSTTNVQNSDTGKNELIHGEQISTSIDVSDSTFGFNSDEAVPTAQQSHEETQSHTGTDTTNTTNSGTSDTTLSTATKDERNSEQNTTTNRELNSSSNSTVDTTGSRSDEVTREGETDDESSSTGKVTTDSTGSVNTISKDVRTDLSSETVSDTDDISEGITRQREGNVGQNSYQELLRQEFEVWKWNFYLQVFEDVDKFLTLSIYSPC